MRIPTAHDFRVVNARMLVGGSQPKNLFKLGSTAK